MAVKLRLMRMGKKKQPTYRVVAADSRSPRDGRFIEVVGVYAPRGRSTADPAAVVQIDDAKVLHWLSNGAKPTDRVERLLEQTGTLERFRSGAPPVAAPSGAATATVPATGATPPAAGTDEAAGSGQAAAVEPAPAATAPEAADDAAAEPQP